MIERKKMLSFESGFGVVVAILDIIDLFFFELPNVDQRGYSRPKPPYRAIGNGMEFSTKIVSSTTTTKPTTSAIGQLHTVTSNVGFPGATLHPSREAI